jgi:2',3'-cyclic-nucleotide 2'-phosphodiesterase (5'-nucleotidase family)
MATTPQGTFVWGGAADDGETPPLGEFEALYLDDGAIIEGTGRSGGAVAPSPFEAPLRGVSATNVGDDVLVVGTTCAEAADMDSDQPVCRPAAQLGVATYDPAADTWRAMTGDLSIRPELVPITEGMPEDPALAAEAQRWVDLAFDAFRADGFEPDEPVTVTDEELDGRAATVRNRSDTLTDLIAEAMLRASPGADASVYNSGSIRIDDILPAGRVTQYDVIRVLPFGGDVVEVEISGALLRRVLDQGVANRGEGGFLQYAGITRTEGPAGAGSSSGSGGDCDCGGGAGAWTVAGAPLDDTRTYRVAFTDFLLTGREEGLGYLTLDNPEVKELGKRGDIRRVVITELQRRYGS